MTLVEVEIDQAGKAPGRGDLYPVREDRDPDVVAGHRVGAVDDGVDDRLHPRLPWDDVNGAEASVRLQGPTTRTPLVDERESGIDDVRNRPLQTPVAVRGHRLPRADAGLIGLVSQHPHQGVGEGQLGVLAEGAAGPLLSARRQQ